MLANSTPKRSSVKQIAWTLVRAVVLAAWVIFGMSLALFIAGLVIGAMPTDTARFILTNTIAQLTTALVVYLCALLVTVGVPYWFNAFVMRRSSETGALRRLLGVDKPFDPKQLGIFLLCVAGYFVTTIALGAIAQHILPGYQADQEQNIGFTDREGALNLVLAFFALVVLPPVIEELLFRGYLFGKLRARSGFWFSAIVTSLVFGFVHGQLNVGVDTFALSIFLCYLRERTGSIWMSMLLHATKNGLAYFLLFIGPLIGISIQ